MDYKTILLRLAVVLAGEIIRIVTTQNSVNGQVSAKLDAASKAAK